MRVHEILAERGITAEAMANDIGYNQGQVSRFLSGKRRANTDFLKAVADYFEISVADLFFTSELQIVGYIGAGAEFFPFNDYAQGDGMETIPAPYGITSKAVAVRVKGTSMIPAYYEGDVLIYSKKRRDITEFLNQRVVCSLEDGRIVVKTPVRGAKDHLFTLTSFNAPPIIDVSVEWVAKIDCVLPA